MGSLLQPRIAQVEVFGTVRCAKSVFWHFFLLPPRCATDSESNELFCPFSHETNFASNVFRKKKLLVDKLGYECVNIGSCWRLEWCLDAVNQRTRYYLLAWPSKLVIKINEAAVGHQTRAGSTRTIATTSASKNFCHSSSSCWCVLPRGKKRFIHNPYSSSGILSPN